MKLTRNTTTDANPDLRGRKHYFTIDNAPAIMLEAMDELLEKAGWENDGCPCYDDGFGCGWWIDIEEVAAFKADYKRLKGEVAAYVARRQDAIDKLLQNVPGATYEEADRAIRAANNHFGYALNTLRGFQTAKEAHKAALIDDATFEENLVFLATPDMADIWNKHGDTLKVRILAAAHAEALALDAEFGNPARFEYVNANGHKQSQLLKEAHAEALEISELVSLGCDAPCFMLHLIIKRQAGGYAVGVTDIPPRVTYNPLAASFWEVMPDLSGRPKDERETRSKMRQFMRDGDSIISIGDAIAETMRFALGANWIEIVRRWEMGK